MASAFVTAFANAREALFGRFGDSVVYSAGGGSGVSIQVIPEVIESSLAFQQDGAGRNRIVMFKLRTADAPAFADGDTLEWGGVTYALRIEKEDDGTGIFVARGASYDARIKGRPAPFIQRGG